LRYELCVSGRKKKGKLYVAQWKVRDKPHFAKRQRRDKMYMLQEERSWIHYMLQGDRKCKEREKETVCFGRQKYKPYFRRIHREVTFTVSRCILIH
jgi:hypothetical protein